MFFHGWPHLGIHDRAAAAVEICVTTKAEVAREPDATALPPLKPNQPNQSSAAWPRNLVPLDAGAMEVGGCSGAWWRDGNRAGPTTSRSSRS